MTNAIWKYGVDIIVWPLQDYSAFRLLYQESPFWQKLDYFIALKSSKLDMENHNDYKRRTIIIYDKIYSIPRLSYFYQLVLSLIPKPILPVESVAYLSCYNLFKINCSLRLHLRGTPFLVDPLYFQYFYPGNRDGSIVCSSKCEICHCTRRVRIR